MRARCTAARPPPAQAFAVRAGRAAPRPSPDDAKHGRATPARRDAGAHRPHGVPRRPSGRCESRAGQPQRHAKAWPAHSNAAQRPALARNARHWVGSWCGLVVSEVTVNAARGGDRHCGLWQKKSRPSPSKGRSGSTRTGATKLCAWQRAWAQSKAAAASSPALSTDSVSAMPAISSASASAMALRSASSMASLILRAWW